MTKPTLEGIRVLDFTWAGAGSFGSGLLARNGAEVLKVESMKRLDGIRRSAPLAGEGELNNSVYFGSSCASKYSLLLNVAHPRGLELAKRLVRLSDLVMDNFRTGTMKKMGLGYEVLKSIKPDIIMIDSSVLGEKGAPWAFAGNAPHGSALGGHSNLLGWWDEPPLAGPDSVTDGTGYSDYVQSMVISVAAMVALDYRRRTGKGQFIDVCHVEPLAYFLSPFLLDYMVNGRQQSRMGNRSLNAAPHGAFPCQGLDKWCVIAISTEEEWHKLCQVMGNPPWSQDPKFATLASRKGNEDELESLIGEWTINYPREEIMPKLQQAGVPAAVVQDMSDIMERDPQIKARESFVSVKHPVMGPYKISRPPWLDKNPFTLFPAPLLGEHNDYVYRELLGLSDDEITELSKDGVLA